MINYAFSGGIKLIVNLDR